MNKKQLKSLIKEMVRESLTEIFVEMKLENIVESVINKNIQKAKTITETFTVKEPKVKQKTINEVFEEEQVEEEQPKLTKEDIRKRMKISDSEWSNIYSNIDPQNPILRGGNGKENPELVSESVLKKNGLMKDYSKFVK